MVLVVDFNNTPGVDTTADFTAIGSRDDPVRANDGKRNFAGNFLMLSNSLLVLVLVSGCLEDVNVVIGDVGKNLASIAIRPGKRNEDYGELTRALNSATSTSVRVSAFAMTGIRLTLSCSCFMNSISRGFKLKKRVTSVRTARKQDGKMKAYE